MNEKKRTTEEFDHWATWEQDTYQTGSTQPPKSHGGLIAFLLGLVIFLSGISTALGLMNIRLFRQLNTQPQETNPPVAFAHAEDTQISEANPEAVRFSLGFAGQTVPEFWNLYQDIPRGVYIMMVEEGSDAHKKGVSAGDVLLCVDGTPVSDAESLTAQLEIFASGELVEVTLCRSGQNLTLELLKE